MPRQPLSLSFPLALLPPTSLRGLLHTAHYPAPLTCRRVNFESSSVRVGPTGCRESASRVLLTGVLPGLHCPGLSPVFPPPVGRLPPPRGPAARSHLTLSHPRLPRRHPPSRPPTTALSPKPTLSAPSLATPNPRAAH